MNDPRPILQQAAMLERAGRLSEAEAAYRQVLNRWPDLADTWYNLALLQRRAGRFDAALASYQQALDRRIREPEEVHLNRGVIYADCLRDDQAAQRELRAALALNPNYVPALLNLANLHEDYGERAAAIELYERILVLQPRCYDALARYGSLHTPQGCDDPLIERIRSSLAANDISSADKASLGFALGKLLDACGAYDAAFDAYREANRQSRASAAPRIVAYDRDRQVRFIDEIIAAFPSAPAHQATAARTPPIFVCGMFRSGSTLAERILASHSRVTAGGELPLLPAMVQTLQPFPAAMRGLSAERLSALATTYMQSLSRLFPGADLVTDKRPDNFLYIGLIKRLFPDARIVHTTRDPLDNCLSIFFLHVDHSMSYALDLGDTAHYYTQYRRLMAHWRALYGDDILDLDYDVLVHEPRAQVERLLRFCGLEWEDACLSFERARGAVKTASVWQVRESLYQRSSGRWRNYARHLREIEELLRTD